MLIDMSATVKESLKKTTFGTSAEELFVCQAQPQILTSKVLDKVANTLSHTLSHTLRPSFPLTLRPRHAIRTIRAMDSKFEQFSKLFANYPSTQSNLSINESAEQNGQ